MSKQGAIFYKCALQVNSYLYNKNYRGGDAMNEEEFNKAILDACIKNQIQVVGLAEHGDVISTENLRNLLSSNGITVFPGFELCSAEKIHIICLFPPDKDLNWLNQMLGGLQGSAVSPGQKTDKSSRTYIEIANKVSEAGGITFAPHVHEDNGLLVVNDGSGGHPDIWKNEKAVLAVQINKPSVDDLDQKFKSIIKNQDANYKRKRPVSVIHAQDVELPETLSNPLATCYIKMDIPSIEGLRQAFLDGESRIRLYTQRSDKRHSKILSVKISSDFFHDNFEVTFNDNLNTIIGGRGTGKSTLLECLRYGLDIPYHSSEAKRRAEEILKRNFINGKIIIKVFSARYNKEFEIHRNYGQSPILRNQDGTLSHLSIKDILPEIRMFGQNEIFEFSEKPDNHIKLIEQFLPELKDEIPEIKKLLKENREKCIQAREKLSELEEKLNRENRLREQLQKLKELGLDKKFEEMNVYEKEGAVLQRSDSEYKEIKTQIEKLEQTVKEIDLAYLSHESLKDFPNKEVLFRLNNSWKNFQNKILETLNIIRQAEQTFLSETVNINTEWKKNKEQFDAEFTQLINKLPDLGARKGSDIAREYKKISQELASMHGVAVQHQHQKKLYDELIKKRRELTDALNNAIDNRFEQINKTVKKLNKDYLTNKLKIEVKKWGNRQQLKDYLKTIEGIGEKKVQWVDDQGPTFNILQFVKDLREKEEADLRESYRLTPAVASALKKMSEAQLMELEEVVLSEKVEITMNVGTEIHPVFTPIEHLSSGQKCTAILNLLLISNHDPLIIDQPEDNLDNAFIAENIVTELRKQKESRQFIFSTHNANIPVFGDAEWIGVLEIAEGNCMLKDENIGSIDNTHLRPKIENILEGGKYAFETRRLKYNY